MNEWHIHISIYQVRLAQASSMVLGDWKVSCLYDHCIYVYANLEIYALSLILCSLYL